MKTIISVLTLTALVLTSSFTATSQQEVNKQLANGSFSYFRAHRQGKAGIGLTWAITNQQASYFVVERSYDGDFFESACTINCTGVSVYKFHDTDVFPGVIHYRIVAVDKDGTTETSAVETIRIVQRK
ncbi:MAG: hypothetical protein V4676_05400 [Bacteroidota bacterium]